MPIISSNFNDIGSTGQIPNIIRIETNDSLATVQTVGYLNVLEKQGLPLAETSAALVGIGSGANKSTVWMALSKSGEDWSLTPTEIVSPSTAPYILKTPDAALPNAQAMSALATGIVKNETTTGTQSIATSNVDYQAADAGLISIAGLTTAADTMIYTTASDVYATTGLTAAGRDLLDDATAGDQLTTLGAQPVDAGLTSIAGLTTAADEMIYTTALDVYATTSLTETGRYIASTPSLETSGYILTSTGSGSAPTFQAAAAGGGVFVQTMATVTPAQMKDLFVTPHLIIAAPGANKFIKVQSVIFEVIFNSISYSGGSGDIAAAYGNFNNIVFQGVSDTTFAIGQNVLISVVLYDSANQITYPDTAINQGIYLAKDTANYTAGDSTVNVYSTYQIIDVAI